MISPFIRSTGTTLLMALALSGTARAQDSNQTECDAIPMEPKCGQSMPEMDWFAPDPADARPLWQTRQCQGDYRDPLADVSTSIDPATQPIHAVGNQSEMDGDLVRVSGGARAQQGYRQLEAEDVEFNQAEGQGSLSGNVLLREPGLMLRGSTGTVNTETGEATLTAASFVAHNKHIYARADFLKRREDRIIDLDDVNYSYCAPNSDSWILYADSMELDLENGEGVARNATIEMKGVPILYTPYLEFPLDDRRKSGFLWAELGSDEEGGADIALPYYFNLAPNYDATLTPRWINDRGLLTEVEFRHLSTQAGAWRLGGAYIEGDDKYAEELPDKDSDRWLVNVDQQGLFKRRWRTSIDWTKTGDDDYLNDFSTTSLQLRQAANLPQRGQLDYLGDDWKVELRVEEFQTIARDVLVEPYKKLPQLTLSRTALEEPFKPNLILLSDYTDFDHDTRTTGQRLYNEVGVSYPMEWVWGFVRPTTKYRAINYELDEPTFFDRDEDDSPDVSAPLLSLDAGLYFEREFTYSGSNYVQTLEPRVYYLWADYEDQTGLPDFDTAFLTFDYAQLYRDTRFSGRDRLDDAKQISAGLTTRLLDVRSGRERLQASIGQIYYFRDRKVNLGPELEEDMQGTSQIAAELNLLPWDSLSMRSSWIWDTNSENLDRGSISFVYDTDVFREPIFNLGYNYRRYEGFNPLLNDTSQINFSSYLPLAESWALFGQIQYDFKDNEHVNDLIGVEYNNCCWRIRVAYERALDQTNSSNQQQLVERDEAYYLQFQLKGLGGVGNRVTGLLEKAIRGFDDRDE